MSLQEYILNLKSQKKLQYVKRMAHRRPNLLKIAYTLSEEKTIRVCFMTLQVLTKAEDIYVDRSTRANVNTLFSCTNSGV